MKAWISSKHLWRKRWPDRKFAAQDTNDCFADEAAVRCKCTKRWASNVCSADKPDPSRCSKMRADRDAPASQLQPTSRRDAAHLPESGHFQRVGWSLSNPVIRCAPCLGLLCGRSCRSSNVALGDQHAQRRNMGSTWIRATSQTQDLLACGRSSKSAVDRQVATV